MIKSHGIVLLFIVPFLSFAQKTDLLVLRNGNHITGEVKKLEYGVLTFDTDDAGLLTVKWKDVMKLKSADSFELTTDESHMFYCSIDTTGNIREISLIIGPSRTPLSMDKLVRIVPIKKTFFSRMDGSINAGASYSKGSKVLKFNIGADLNYRTYHDLLQLSGYSEITRQKFSEDTTGITRKQDLHFIYTHYFNKHWLVAGFTGVEQNTELGLKVRPYLGTGGGKDVVYTNLQSLTLLGGFVGNKEYASSGGNTNNIEGVAVFTYRIYKYTMPRVILTTNVQNFYSINNPGRIRLNADIRIDFELVKDFTIGFSNYHNYDNEPVSIGASTYDWGINTTIGYTF